MKITVYKVKAGGSVKYVDKTREGALLWATTSLKEIWGDIPYRILSETLDVPETTGVIWSDKETAHVDWSCPHCGESHFTDLDTDESPALWLCEKVTQMTCAWFILMYAHCTLAGVAIWAYTTQRILVRNMAIAGFVFVVL